MWRATIKGIVGHKARLVLTATAVMLGVAFVSGTFVFTDTIGNAFDGLFSDAFAGIDVEVRYPQDDDLSFLQVDRVPDDLLTAIQAIPEVETAWGNVIGYAQIVDRDGRPVSSGGAPTFGFSWPAVDDAGGFRLRDGSSPQRPDEVVIDAATARKARLEIGDAVDVLFSGPTRSFTIVGVAGFGTSASPGGATAAIFDLGTARDVLGASDGYDSISVIGTPGVEPEALAGAVALLLPPGVEALTGQTAAAASADVIKDQLGVITTVILVFAGIALFVGAFLIQNTFRIVVAHRTRELALLRALGATGTQITRMVVLEAALIGLGASVVGVAGGVGLALVLRWVFTAAGATFPQGATEVAARTVFAGLGVGTFVTVASALLPARKAAAIPPVAALQTADLPPDHRSMTLRAVTGGSMTAAGLAAIAVGLFTEIDAVSNLAVVGAGAGATFVGIAVLSAVIARPLSRGIGWAIAGLLGVPGRLARDNAARSPRRTSATASALMVGLTLISGIAVLIASLGATIDDVLSDSFTADFIVQQPGAGFGPPAGISPTVADRLEELAELDQVSRVRASLAKAEGRVTLVGAVQPNITTMFGLDIVGGDLGDLVPADSVAIKDEQAEATGITVGDTVQIEFARTGLRTLRVVAVWAADALQSPYLLSLDGFRANFVEDLDTAVYVTLAAGVGSDAGRRAIQTVTDDFATANVLDTAGFRAEARSQLDQLLTVISGLLGLAILISFWGITNTLALSVIERTREIAILRAMGMSRSQVRRMIRWEAVIVAVFGAVLGVSLGIALGWIIVRALSSDGILFALPAGRLAALVAGAGFAGVVAAIYPASRAAKLNIIRSIAYE